MIDASGNAVGIFFDVSKTCTCDYNNLLKGEKCVRGDNRKPENPAYAEAKGKWGFGI